MGGGGRVRLDVAVDIGNSRMKWGRCHAESIRDLAVLPLVASPAWAEQAGTWQLPRPATWAVAGVNPPRIREFLGWLHERGDMAYIIQSYRQVPLSLNVAHPDTVGLDRLLGALAGWHFTSGRRPAITVDVGTAMTINLVNESGQFCGGAILPGYRLMAQALNAHTAALPLVGEEAFPLARAAGTTTEQAIHLGIRSALRGAAQHLVTELSTAVREPPAVFITGGGAAWLRDQDIPATEIHRRSTLNLEGIRLAAEQGLACPT